MLAGLLLLSLPIVLFLATIPVSGRLSRRLRQLYLILGGVITVAGSAISLYLAAYTGDQGGIAAYFFQLAVILVYVIFAAAVLVTNWILRRRKLNGV